MFLVATAVLAAGIAAGGGAGTHSGTGVAVPDRVADLVRPILDEALARRLQPQDSDRHLGELLTGLIRRSPGPDEDEALVVLLCFAIGESQEDADAVIARGRRMLPLLSRYASKVPRIRDRSYPATLLKDRVSKAATFEGVRDAIRRGLRGTWDNPKG